MAVYSLARRTTNVTIANPCIEIIAGAYHAVRIIEISIILAGATAVTLGIGRPAAIGVTPTTPVNCLPEDTSDTMYPFTTALAWATPPTVPANFQRRITLPAAVGAGIVLPFSQGFHIEPAASLVVWNITTNDVCDINIIAEI